MRRLLILLALVPFVLFGIIVCILKDAYIYIYTVDYALRWSATHPLELLTSNLWLLSDEVSKQAYECLLRDRFYCKMDWIPDRILPKALTEKLKES